MALLTREELVMEGERAFVWECRWLPEWFVLWLANEAGLVGSNSVGAEEG